MKLGGERDPNTTYLNLILYSLKSSADTFQPSHVSTKVEPHKGISIIYFLPSVSLSSRFGSSSTLKAVDVILNPTSLEEIL